LQLTFNIQHLLFNYGKNYSTQQQTEHDTRENYMRSFIIFTLCLVLLVWTCSINEGNGNKRLIGKPCGNVPFGKLRHRWENAVVKWI